MRALRRSVTRIIIFVERTVISQNANNILLKKDNNIRLNEYLNSQLVKQNQHIQKKNLELIYKDN